MSKPTEADDNLNAEYQGNDKFCDDLEMDTNF